MWSSSKYLLYAHQIEITLERFGTLLELNNGDGIILLPFYVSAESWLGNEEGSFEKQNNLDVINECF